MENISPQYLSLASLLNKRLFRIPDYQRAYSWTSEQRKDLFADIDKIYARGIETTHFMATAVCLRKEKQVLGTDEFNVLEIVDGQQRLTSLIILLKTIALALDRNNPDENQIASDLETLLVKPEAGALLLLQTNHDSSHYFANFLRSGSISAHSEARTLPDKELLKAMEECVTFVATWKQGERQLSELVKLLKNRLFFLLHEIREEKSVYTVFEVLNSRGIEVSWLDRFKSILMGAAFELEACNKEEVINELHQTWRDIYTCIGLRQGMSTEALKFAATLKTETPLGRPLGEKDAVAELRANATDANGIIAIAQWLLRVTRAYDRVIANARLNAVTSIAQARLLAVAINLRDDIETNQKTALLQRWEKVSFRTYGMLENDARNNIGDYVRLAWQVINEQLETSSIDEALRNIGSQFPISEAVDNLRNTDCYTKWKPELRYFMFRYEEHLSRERGFNFRNEQWERIWLVSPSDSIEHIYPQSNADENDRHRLGNLVLLPPGLNSTLGNSAPLHKVDAYRKTGLLIASEVADMILARNQWDTASIDARENTLLNWALMEWGD